MTCLADLHTHTTASDGQYAPSQLAAKALAAGIQILAVTDHDTIDGAEEAVRAGETCGLTVLRGVELGAREDRHMHILGLNLGPECPVLAELCRRLRASREERKYRIAAFLREKGMDVPLEEVEALAGGGVVARPHFARVMLRHGYVSSLRDAFDRYLDTDEYQRIERWKASAAECIAAIHDAGGKAVLAHPYQLGCSHGAAGEDPPRTEGRRAGWDRVLLSPAFPRTDRRLSASCGEIRTPYHRGQRFSRGGRSP